MMARKFVEFESPDEIFLKILENQEELISPTIENCINLPTSKGIYFWYLNQAGLDFIASRLAIPSCLSTPDCWNDTHKLVYIGTAGTRMTNDNKGHLKQRLEWHIMAKHRPSSILSGTLSTLRTTLGSILSEDLIHFEGQDTGTLINDFMAQNFRIGYITYDGGLPDISNSINEDETILIKTLKPLFNIKNNPNKSLNGHPTHSIRLKRMQVNFSTKTRLQCAL